MWFAPHDPEIFLQEFRKIRTGIYDTPDDFVIKDASKSPLFEPVDQELWRACAGSSTVTHFPLDRIYKVLQASENCNHIWAIFGHIFSISRESKLELVCLIKPGLYSVPIDLTIMRTNRQAPIGGYSYKLISKKLHSDCYRLFALGRDVQQLRLAEIYAGLWILGGFHKSIFSEMRVIMEYWLQNEEFSKTEEGMLTKLVLKLGQDITAESIASLVAGRVLKTKYCFARLLRGGESHWYAKFQSRESWQEPRATLEELDKVCVEQHLSVASSSSFSTPIGSRAAISGMVDKPTPFRGIIHELKQLPYLLHVIWLHRNYCCSIWG